MQRRNRFHRAPTVVVNSVVRLTSGLSSFRKPMLNRCREGNSGSVCEPEVGGMPVDRNEPGNAEIP